VLRKQLVELLTNFESELHGGDLRAKVRALVPVFRLLRGLGSSLIPESEAASGRDRILAYLLKYPNVIIAGEELMVVAGIDDWARRVRELRVELGWAILSGDAVKDMVADVEEGGLPLKAADGADLSMMKVTEYILTSTVQDREAAHRWHVANEIRKKKISVKDKVLEFLTVNVGRPVTGDELRYLADDKSEWARRVRELRTEEGWPVMTRTTGRPDVPVGAYVLASTKQAEPHDRAIPDYVRAEVLTRDNYTCQYEECGWNQDQWNPASPRHLELHHNVHHARGGENTPANLITYCNIHHDKVHREER
jgi:hypothetical protein